MQVDLTSGLAVQLPHHACVGRHLRKTLAVDLQSGLFGTLHTSIPACVIGSTISAVNWSQSRLLLQGPSQAPPEPHLASGQPNQQPFHSQQHGLPGVTADPSLPPGTLPPQHPRAAAAQHLQHMDDVPQLASAPGLDPQSIPLALQDGPPQQPAQQHAVATPLAGPSLQVSTCSLNTYMCMCLHPVLASAFRRLPALGHVRQCVSLEF